MNAQPRIPELSGPRRRAWIVFAVAGLLSAVGAAFDLEQLWRSWLLAFLFWIAFPLGAFAVRQIHLLTGGAWGRPAQTVLEGAARTLPLFALLFLPLLLGAHSLYEWTHGDAVAHDPLLQHKQPYLNLTFFGIRAAVYFAIWILAIRVQDGLSRRLREAHDTRLERRRRTIAAPALGLYALCMTFAAFDWGMSLEPHWFSSIYGVSFIVGQGLTGFALSIVVASALARRSPDAGVADPDQFHDLGKLMFAFVLLWAYVSYSQFLLIWSGNLLEEIPWYLARTTGGWQWVALFLIVLHFALPFLLLLSRRLKRDPRTLVLVAGALLAFRWLDIAWYILPAFRPGTLHFHWLDLSVSVAVGALWIAVLTRQLEGRPYGSTGTSSPDPADAPLPHAGLDAGARS